MDNKRRNSLQKIQINLDSFIKSVPSSNTHLSKEMANQLECICDALYKVAEENHDKYTALEESNLKYRDDFHITEECDDHLQEANNLLAEAINNDEVGETLIQTIKEIIDHISYAIAKQYF